MRALIGLAAAIVGLVTLPPLLASAPAVQSASSQPDTKQLVRFWFVLKGNASGDATQTAVMDFEEKQRPTLVRTARGKDLPLRSTVWVIPADGTIARICVERRGFADEHVPDNILVAMLLPPDINVPFNPAGTPMTVGRAAKIESSLDVDVTFSRDADMDTWLPSKMTQSYEGAVPMHEDDRPGPRALKTRTVSEYAAYLGLPRPSSHPRPQR